ncbi:MAG TPA: ATP-binding protein [Candidatus Acidoferrales bacterium]|nr:ATP-binding protein [Candidatus Acidoferrales bacterium]
MKLTIFRRLIGGHILILLLALSGSVFAIFILGRFETITRSIRETDDRVLEYEKKLSDTLLSQIQYERKYLIGRDEVLYSRFLLFNNDFKQYLEEAAQVATAPRMAELLDVVRQSHRRYLDLFSDEVEKARAGTGYDAAAYKEKKDHATEAALRALRELRTVAEQTVNKKIRTLGEIGASARQITLAVTLLAVLSGIAIALWTTRSITRPVGVLKTKTAEIAQGHLGTEIDLASPPEIAELAAAFNSMSRQLKDIDKMKSDFFFALSHELRTPLTSIKEGTQLLLDGAGGPISDNRRKILRILSEESERLIRLVNSILDLSKMEAGMMTYRFEEASLGALIEKATTEILPLVESKRVSLALELSPELRRVKIDQERILQVLRNLLGNAINFTPEGGSIKVCARPLNGKVEVAVQDTGPGIAPEHLERIFEKYHQVATGNRFPKGTGLGLAIARHIVTAHGGSLWAESQPGSGSKFIFVLPA